MDQPKCKDCGREIGFNEWRYRTAQGQQCTDCEYKESHRKPEGVEGNG